MSGQRSLLSTWIALMLALTTALADGGCATTTVAEGQPRQLTGQSSQNFLDDYPIWLSDDRILFSRLEVGLMSMNLDGGDLRQIPNTNGGESCLDLSPDGRRVAFAKDGSLFVMNLDGSALQRVTQADKDGGCPRWSPDGNKLSFYSDRGGSEQLYIMNSDGSQVTQLTRLPYHGFIGEWEPDGKAIAFVDTVYREILLIPSEGGSPIQITRDGMTKGSGLTWSSEGRWIIYGACCGGFKKPSGMYAIRPDGTGGRLILQGVDPWNPSLSPKGDMVTFSQQRQVEGRPLGSIYLAEVGDRLK